MTLQPQTWQLKICSLWTFAFAFFSKMADETKKMAASPLHDAAAEEEESKSSSAMFVTPALEDEGEPEKTAVESKESGSAMVPAGENYSPKLDSAAMAEAKIAASPLHQSVEPTAEDLPEGPKETPAEELPEAVIEGTTAAPTAEKTAQEKRSQELFEQNELGKKELQETIQARIDAAAADELAAAALLEAKDDVQEGPAEKPAAPAEEPKPDAPFNVFGIANTKEAGLQVKEEPQGSDEEPEALVLNDLRKCEKCHGMSYLRQGLCVNVYCSLYYMWNPQAGTRLTARGHLNEGNKWSPSEWGKGQYQRVEEELLSTAFKDEVKQAQEFGDPPMEIASKAMKIASKAKELAAASSSNPIEIEDIETGEISQHGGEKAAEAEYHQNWSPADKAVDYVESDVSPQLLQASRRVRNKGWKRVASLAAKITEKKQRGEWKGPEVPIPRNVLPFLTERLRLEEKKDQQWTAKWIWQYWLLRLAW